MNTPARWVVAVGSGKGGVGKSTISLSLSVALAQTGSRVGLLDADFYGPNIALMVNVARSKWLENWDVWRKRRGGEGIRLDPVERYGVKIMSAGFLIGEDQPFTLDANLIELVIRQLVHDVSWGELDFLIVDLPPGTADVQQGLLKVLPLTGVMIVVTPQDVAHLDAKKVLNMYRRAGVRVIGGVENMSGLVCPHCHELVDLYPRVPDERSLWAMGVEAIGKIPFDPAMGIAGDAGTPAALYDEKVGDSFRELAEKLRRLLSG